MSTLTCHNIGISVLRLVRWFHSNIPSVDLTNFEFLNRFNLNQRVKHEKKELRVKFNGEQHCSISPDSISDFNLNNGSVPLKVDV